MSMTRAACGTIAGSSACRAALACALTAWLTHPAHAVPSYKRVGLGAVTSHGLAITPDGATIAGFGLDENLKYTAFRWDKDSGARRLATQDGSLPPEAIAQAVSADGRVIVGWMRLPSGRQAAYRWTRETGYETLGFLPDQPDMSPSYATSVSDDGLRVVGYNGAPWVWTRETGLTALPLLKGSIGDANSISRDGTAIAGNGAATNGDRMTALRWKNRVPEDLLGTAGADVSANATATNADGSIVVGTLTRGNKLEAYRWSEAGGMQMLGFLPGNRKDESNAYAVSADGTTVVGDATGRKGIEPTVWTAETGMISLTPFLGLGTTEEEDIAQAVNADCRIITGGASIGTPGNVQAFRCERTGG